jgi:phosphate transport system substrate-binding protein
MALYPLLILFSHGGAAEPAGRVAIDGSSTVAPITMAAAELFEEQHPAIRVTVGVSGTGGGFKKFLDEHPELRMDICDASRPIKPAELERAAKLGIEFYELPIAMDGLAVVVHPSNSFCSELSVPELKRIWEPGSTVNNWKDVRPGFPDLPLKLYGAGTDSGTFDYFTEAIVGKERASRSDYTASESDNVLVQGVSGDKGALGYFGYSYFEMNKQKLKAVGIAGEGPAVIPNPDTIRSGRYRPLARPLFLYINKKCYERPEVRAFVDFLLDNAPKIVEHPRVGYVALPDELYRLGKERIQSGTTGTVFTKTAGQTHDLAELYRRKDR